MGKKEKKSGSSKTKYKEEWLFFVLAALFLFFAYMNEDNRILFVAGGLACFVVACLIIKKQKNKVED